MRFTKIVPMLLAFALCGCVNNQRGTAKVEDLMIKSGIADRKLVIDGSEGVTSTFTFRANHDWKIIDYKGFSCYPSSGLKTADGETEVITVTPLQSNNTADTIRLSDLNFKMLSTRFVGISAYQLPQIRLPKGNRIVVDALNGSSGKITFVTSAEDVDIVVDGNISATLGDKNNKNEYTVTVSALEDNGTASNRIAGTVGFCVDGVMQESKIEVLQTSAIVSDRSVVMLPSMVGGENMLVVDSGLDIDVTTKSNLFTITKVDKKTFVVKALADNTSSDEVSLGYIDISLVLSPDCRTSIEVKQRKAKASQTIIVHFIGTALQTYYNHNVDRMLAALNADIQGDAQILAITTDSTNDATLYELRYDSSLGKAVKEKVKELSLPTPYNSALFEANLRAALEFAPADKYALLIGSHGLAWVPKTPTQTTSRKLQRMGIDPSSLWERAEGAEMTRHLGDKEPTRYDIAEVSAAIMANNVKFEYILFDACFMGNIETAYELRNTAKYIVASPCEVMGAGFPYAKVVPYMLTNGGASYDLDKICSEYVKYYNTEAATPSACVAVTVTSELDALASAMKSVNAAAVKSEFSLNSVQYYEGQTPHSFYDLGHMVEQSCADASVASAFKSQLDKAVISRYHTPRFYSAYGGNNKYYHDINYYSGITTSANVEHYSAEWQKTAWYQATH